MLTRTFLRAFLHVASLVALAHAFTDCNARASGGSLIDTVDDGSSGTDGGFGIEASSGPGSVSAFCTSACQQQIAAGCVVDGGVSLCASACSSALATYDNTCPGPFAALSSCVAGTTPSCTGSPYSACMSQLTSLAQCVAMSRLNDAGNSGVDVPASGTCARLCARVASIPGCSAQIASCSTSCAALQSQEARCPGPVSEFIACATSTPISCTGSTINFPSCTAAEMALVACAGFDAGTRVDAGFPVDVGIPSGCSAASCGGCPTCTDCTAQSDCGWCNGQCYQGTSTGPTGATCVDTWAWTSAACTM